MQPLALERRFRNHPCNSVGKSADFIMKPDTIWGGFEALANSKVEETKRAFVLLVIKEALPQVFIQVITQPGIAYDELKRAVVAS